MSRKKKTTAGTHAPAAPHKAEGELATLGRRLSSMLYEALLLIGVLFVAYLLPLIMSGMLFDRLPPVWVQRVYFFCILGVYFVTYWYRFGQTLAMQTWKLRITNRAGKNITLGQAMLRYLLAWCSLALLGFGFWWAWFDPEKQFLHDRLTGCRIVFVRRGG